MNALCERTDEKRNQAKKNGKVTQKNLAWQKSLVFFLQFLIIEAKTLQLLYS
ncbi:hypothetical protein BGP_6087 [Beggiatoa sp. PS]|nr:hypothetical protein BGP_6087 [Beggiatoa sp. PS]